MEDSVNELPDPTFHNQCTSFLTTTYCSAIMPPDEVRSADLLPEQREFFGKYRPDTVERFTHDG
mgnify:CR=1 FL=1